jgi:hypothetical protein
LRCLMVRGLWELVYENSFPKTVCKDWPQRKYRIDWRATQDNCFAGWLIDESCHEALSFEPNLFGGSFSLATSSIEHWRQSFGDFQWMRPTGHFHVEISFWSLDGM